MKRPPNIKDKLVLQYVEYLESELSSDSTEKKLWRGMKRQMNFIADELLSPDFKVSFNDEEKADRFFKLAEKAIPITKGIKEFEKTAFPPDPAKGDDKKPLSEESAENYLKK